MGDALAHALRLLAGGERSRAELRAALARFDSEEAEEALARLEAWGFVADERVALALVRRRSGRRARGDAALRAELEARGLPEEAVALALAAAPEPDETARALDLLKARFPGGTDPPRAARFLLARGFDPETVETLLGANDPAPDDVEGG